MKRRLYAVALAAATGLTAMAMAAAPAASTSAAHAWTKSGGGATVAFGGTSRSVDAWAWD